jgi:hypothetical protein
MSERALVVHKVESFQVPAIIAHVGPETTKRFFWPGHSTNRGWS